MTGAWEKVIQKQLEERDRKRDLERDRKRDLERDRKRDLERDRKRDAERERINLYQYVQGGYMTLQSAATITGLTEDAFQEQMDAYFQTLELQGA